MAVTKTDRIIRMTADDDVYNSGLKALQIKGIRLIAGAAAACRAQVHKGIDATGPIVAALAAVTGSADEMVIPLQIDGGDLFLNLTESTGEVYVYLE